jgi:flagellar protein FliL
MKAPILLALAAALAFAGGYGAGLLPPAGAEAPDQDPDLLPDAVPSYVGMGQFAVPVLRNGRTTSFVLAEVTLEASGPVAAETLRRRLPHARDALLRGLYSLAGEGFFDTPAVDPAAAAAALARAAEAQFGPGLVRAVLFDRLMKQNNNRL